MSSKQYFIDGNNLIGKIPSIKKLQDRDKQASREKIAFTLDRFFINRKEKVILFLDGFQNEAIRTAKLRIRYSDNKTADDIIKHEIDISKNPKQIIVVSSDHSVMEYAKVSYCEVQKSEEFAKVLKKSKSGNKEEEIIKNIDNDEIKKLFGVD